MISQYNIVHKKQLTNALLLSVSVAVNVIFNLILIPKFGINGAAIATLIGHFVSGACFIVFFVKKSTAKLNEILFIKRQDLKTLKSFLKTKKDTVKNPD